MRALVKSLVPPIIVDAMREKPKFYQSWEAACAASGSYSDELVNRFRVERSRLRTPDGSLLARSALALIGKPGMRVTDFGGGTGDLGIEFMAAFPGSIWTVVENPTLVQMMANSPIRYTTQIPDECDLFFTSGTLQCIADPERVIDAAFRTAKTAAVFARNSFSETEIFRVRHSPLFDNGAGPIPEGYENRVISYPNRTTSETAIMSAADRCGFRCAARLQDDCGPQLVFYRTDHGSVAS